MKNILNKIKQKLSSRTGQNTLTFLTFLAISSLFWLLMSLNDEIQKDYELSVLIEDMPEDISLLTSNGQPPIINVTVKDKGVNLLSKNILNSKKLKIAFKDFNDTENNRLSLNETQLSINLRQLFGSTATIINQTPDSLSINYTTTPPIKVPVIVKTHLSPKPQFIISGQVIPSVDSVLLYTPSNYNHEVKAIFTETVTLSNISDTTTVNTQLIKPSGCRTVPSDITITIPVEPLISKTFDIPVEVINLPYQLEIVTFPSSVKFTCLVPMSLFNSASYPIKAYADYNKRNNNTIPLELSIIPDNYHNGNVSPQNIEYILENSTSK